ncbi:hypothetical protein SLA2020_406370 [Shorea laevis]
MISFERKQGIGLGDMRHPHSHDLGTTKTQDELMLSCGAQGGETIETVGKRASIPDAYCPNNNYNLLVELTN